MFRILIAAFVIILPLIFFGCTSLDPVRVVADISPNKAGKLPEQPEFDAMNSKECYRSNSACVHIVEYDEFGNVFSRAQLNAGVAAAKEVAEDGGSVIVFIHGWHHSAKPDDKNLKKFMKSVSQLNIRTKKKAVGIYIGWRGDSINSDNLILKLPSYALTFWDRKSTAHSIGNGGGVSELIRKLSAIRSDNSTSQLMILGHSFGGAIVYSAVSQLVAEQISMDAVSGENKLIAGQHFSPIADLVVLLNPAFEAMRMAPLYSLARTNNYPDGLAPRIVVITSTADWATRITFPLGRYLGTLFQGYPNSESAALNRTAIGHYVPYITHQLVSGECTNQQFQEIEKILPELNAYEGDNNDEICFKGSKPEESLVITRCDAKGKCGKVASDHFITRGVASEGYIPYRFPIANIRTNGTMITGHGAIWDDDIKLFLLGLLEAAINNSSTLPTIPME